MERGGNIPNLADFSYYFDEEEMERLMYSLGLLAPQQPQALSPQIQAIRFARGLLGNMTPMAPPPRTKQSTMKLFEEMEELEKEFERLMRERER